MERKERLSNIELLRFFSILIIIGHHFVLYNGLTECIDINFVNRIWVQFLLVSGKLGVSLFILISGYFLIETMELKVEKLLKLWLQIFTYSILAYLFYIVILASATGENPFCISELLKNCFPLVYQNWWFASTYVVLYLFSPFLNYFLTSLNKKQYQRLLILASVCWCIIPTSFGKAFECNHLMWFFYLYSIAGYIRRYDVIKAVPYSGNKCIIGALLIVFGVLFCLDRIKILFLELSDYQNEYSYFTGENGEQRLMLLIILVSLLLFIGFQKTKIRNNKIINHISSATFGIYLIHDNPYIRSFLWNLLNKGKEYSNKPSFIPFSLSVTLLIFLGCLTLELVRSNLLEKHYLKAVKSLSVSIETSLRNSRLWEKGK